jgi:glycosyltransferase involved in cell wall biosynthesis
VKVLISALGCEPGKGSELEVGYRAVLAAARRHEVWVLTNADSVPAITGAIPDAEMARIHLEGIEFGLDEGSVARLTTAGFHWYYDRWQRRAAARALELDRRIDFDLVHHVTLASYWTRAGAATVPKPFVWGPVGGGVETPWRLVPELGWRGLGEELGRLTIRRAVGRVGPARRPQRTACVTFAQNKATAGRVKSRAEVVILTNATVVDVDHIRPSGPRSKDIYLVGRLIPWKAPILAVRAMRYVQSPGCTLHICGDGPERRRLERAARRWGVRDRVSFDGWLPRDVLLERVGSAGALIHPALHEEAGLCVAEALAMGTPVVCLNWGGPAEILEEWPAAEAVAVEPANARSTARAMAAAVDDFLARAPEVRQSPLPPGSSFQDELLEAYERAVGRVSVLRRRLRAVVWAFPRAKPQVFANTPRAVGSGISVYAFGRRVPRPVQAAAVALMRFPGLRSVIAERHDRPDPVCGWKLWEDILERVERTRQEPGEWLHLRSQWAKQRSSALALDSLGTPSFLVLVEARERVSFHPDIASQSFHVPARLDSFDHEGYHVRIVEALPRYHRAAGWDPALIRRIVDEISKSLEEVLPPPRGAPVHWAPLHGDFVPWNLREDGDGGLWLVDWEDAGWGPPLADAVRYCVAHQSLHRVAPVVAARNAQQMFRADPVDLTEVADFWLRHHNLRLDGGHREVPRRKARDSARAAREIETFRHIARL